MKISIFGLGYIGSVTGASFAAAGHDVIGVDANPDKVALVNPGRSPVIEPGLDDMLASAVAGGKIRATTCPKETVRNSELALIRVGTPSQRNGPPNLHNQGRVTPPI